MSLVDNISFVFPKSPPLSQPEDIPPQQYCNGDDRPSQCGANCMCTHNVDIPLNAIVEVVLVDEGNLQFNILTVKNCCAPIINIIFCQLCIFACAISPVKHFACEFSSLECSFA